MCMHVSAYIFERSGYAPPLTTLDVHHNNIYAHIYLYVLMHVPCLYDLKLRCMSRVWCVRIVMAFNGLSILLSEKKTQWWCMWGWWVGAMLQPFTLYLLHPQLQTRTLHLLSALHILENWESAMGEIKHIQLLPHYSTLLFGMLYQQLKLGWCTEEGVQWNLFIMGTLGPAISGSFLLLYRGFPLSEVKMY